MNYDDEFKQRLNIGLFVGIVALIALAFIPRYDNTIVPIKKVPYVDPGSNDTDESCNTGEQTLLIKERIIPGTNTKVMWNNGCVKQIYELDADGKRHGNALLFYPNGKLKETGLYEHDALLSRKQYSREGNLIRVNLLKDAMHDFQIDYDPKTGELESVITVIFNAEGDPVADGEWFEFTKDPNRFIRVSAYTNGVQNGEKKEYRADGSLWITGEYKEGKRNGVEVYYTPEGKVEATKHYVDDREVP
ncbi:MAG: hypothetical protein PHQ22_09035 [Sulfuricurvum sp.]|nr:hypothetical protein [Sulfuricurvum sp.]